MGKLIYSMLRSLDGYTEDEHCRFNWGAPEDEEVHSDINALASSLGTGSRAAQAIRAGLVDAFQMIVCPTVVGGGKRFFPDGVRLDLELFEQRRFVNGAIILRYGVRGAARGLA
jgi:hypothetical protein